MDRRTFLSGAAALVLTPRGLARFSFATALALVTAAAEPRLVAVDLASGRSHHYAKTFAQSPGI